MEERLIRWLTRYGLEAVFGLQVLGIVGVPVPDEILLTIAGSLVKAGKLPAAGTFAAAILGCAVGITISYVAGRYVGLRTLKRLLHIHDDQLRRVQEWFCRWGGLLLTFGYFVPGVRHVTAIAAGTSGLGFGRFAAYAYPGAVLWSSLFVGLGYVMGERWRRALDLVRPHLTTIGVAALVAYLIVLAVINRARIIALFRRRVGS